MPWSTIRTLKWFVDEWMSLLSGVRLYVHSGYWTDELQDLALLDTDGKRQQTNKDMVRPFTDNNGDNVLPVRLGFHLSGCLPSACWTSQARLASHSSLSS